MLKLSYFWAIMVVVLLAACGPSEPEITFSNIWGRPSIGSSANGAFYMTIHNEGTVEDRLIAAAADVCRSTELHETSLDEQDVMMMRQVEQILIPAGGTVELKMGGHHIMCLDRLEDFSIGQQIPLTLTFELSGDMAISAEIRE